jgi:hypothetical protein
MTEKTRLQRIFEILGPEKATIFAELYTLERLEPDDPELRLAFLMATLIGGLLEFKAWAEKQLVAWGEFFARIMSAIELAVMSALTKGLDEGQTELRMMAREMVVSEFTAASLVRSAAIADEVRALRTAAEDLARERQKLEALRLAGGTGGGHGSDEPFSRKFLWLYATIAACLIVVGAVSSTWFSRHVVPTRHAAAQTARPVFWQSEIPVWASSRRNGRILGNRYRKYG